MGHAGVYLFVFTVCLAAASGVAILVRRSREAYESAVFDRRDRAEVVMQANAEPVSAHSNGLQFAMKATVTLLILAAALYIILSRKFGNDQEKWAFGAIGTILGYWLKG